MNINVIIVIYSIITFSIFIIWTFDVFDDDNFVKCVLLWPLFLIKLIIKELFKLLFTDWK